MNSFASGDSRSIPFTVAEIMSVNPWYGDERFLLWIRAIEGSIYRCRNTSPCCLDNEV